MTTTRKTRDVVRRPACSGPSSRPRSHHGCRQRETTALANPAVWVEAQFTTRGITSQKSRFDHVISSLSPEFAMEVRDLLLLRTPTILSRQLIKRTAASKLISGEELGDRKPTQQLLGDELGTADDGNSFLREPFLQRLPAMVLASADGSMDLHKLADMADKVMEVAMPTEIKQLRNEVARLADLVSSLTTQSRRRSPSQPRRPNSPAPPNSPPPGSLCWYHAKFGQAAQKCREPCSWGNSEAGR